MGVAENPRELVKGILYKWVIYVVNYIELYIHLIYIYIIYIELLYYLYLFIFIYVYFTVYIYIYMYAYDDDVHLLSAPVYIPYAPW